MYLFICNIFVSKLLNKILHLIICLFAELMKLPVEMNVQGTISNQKSMETHLNVSFKVPQAFRRHDTSFYNHFQAPCKNREAIEFMLNVKFGQILANRGYRFGMDDFLFDLKKCQLFEN